MCFRGNLGNVPYFLGGQRRGWTAREGPSREEGRRFQTKRKRQKPPHNDALRGASIWTCYQSKGQRNQSQTGQSDYCSTPSAIKASETALGPGRAHDRRAGAPTGRMTAHPTKKRQRKKKFAVDGRSFLPSCRRRHIVRR